jgi:hypothetical protein
VRAAEAQEAAQMPSPSADCLGWRAEKGASRGHTLLLVLGSERLMLIKRDGSLLTVTALNPNNVWSGSAFEYLRGPSFVQIGLITPGAAGGLLAAMYVGASLIAEEFEVPFSDPAVRGTDYPMIAEAYLISAAGAGGDRLVTTLRNPTGGTLTYSAVALITPSGRRG